MGYDETQRIEKLETRISRLVLHLFMDEVFKYLFGKKPPPNLVSLGLLAFCLFWW